MNQLWSVGIKLVGASSRSRLLAQGQVRQCVPVVDQQTPRALTEPRGDGSTQTQQAKPRPARMFALRSQGGPLSKRTLLFLHGIKNDDQPRRWVDALDATLRRSGTEDLAGRGYEIHAPSYLDLLDGPAPTGQEPPQYTYRRPAAREEEKAQAGRYWLNVSSLERSLASVPRPEPSALGNVPADALAAAFISSIAGQAHRFSTSSARRHAVYGRILEGLPKTGRLTIIAHSLGSVVLADLLYHLPSRVRVELVITVGSPLGLEGLRRHLRRLREDFPFGSVDAWLNVVGHRDYVTGFHGIAASFPEALDVFVDNGGLTDAHDGCRYLEQRAVVAALDWIDSRAADSAAPDKLPNVVIPRGLLSVLVGAQYALRLEQAMEPGERRSRFAAARALTSAEISAAISGTDLDHPVLQRLLRDNAALLRGRFSDNEALGLLLTAWPSNPINPFDVKLDNKARRTALANLAGDLGVTTNWATAVEKATAAAAEAHGGFDPIKALLVLGGVAAVLAAPMLVLAFAPAGLAGGAALVAGLAALGPGGMLGGLAIVGAVGGLGGTVAATALTAGSSEVVQQNVTFLQALALARKTLQLSVIGYPEWFLLATMENQVVRELRRLRLFSDDGASGVKELERKLRHIQRALHWMRDRDLSPKELTTAARKELTAGAASSA